jgi:hypothetical protein
MKDKSPGLPFPDERRSGRRPASLAATVRPLHGLPQAVRIEDVNALGCSLSGCALAAGDEIWLQADAHDPVRAQVVWTKAGRAGCRFHAPAHALAAGRAAAAARPDRVAVARPHPLRGGLR